MKNRVRRKIEKLVASPVRSAILSFVLMATLMVAYQSIKDAVMHSEVRLSNHLVTILFTATVSFLVTLSVAKSVADFYAEYRAVEDSNELHKAGMTAALHYLGNAMTTFQLIELEVEMDGSVSEATLQTVHKTMEATSAALKQLSAMENPSSEKILSFLKEDLKKS